MRLSPYFHESVLRCIAYAILAHILTATAITCQVVNSERRRKFVTDDTGLDGEISLDQPMSIELYFTDHPLYLEVHMEGKFNQALFDDAVSVIYSEALARRTKRILCNCRKLSGGTFLPDGSDLTASFSRLWKNKIRIAIVAPPTSQNQKLKKMQIEQRANVSVFANARSAPEWLVKE